MKVVADENIPLVEHYFGACGELLLKSGRHITRDDVFDADILLTRSVTKVDKLLLHDTPIKFVGSTTAGIDHLDTEWLDQAGIQWSVAEGCNAMAVAEYVVCTVAALQKQGLLMRPELRAAVIGVGHVGRRVAEKLKILGFQVLLCDPLRAAKEPHFPHVALDDLADLDFITLHTPLIRQDDFPTYHLIEKHFLQRQKQQCVLLSAGRGEVVSFDDLKRDGNHLHWCLDVWEHEPKIDMDVLNAAMIATPHIAGYSVQARLRGVEMIYAAAVRKQIIPPIQSVTPEKNIRYIKGNLSDWRDVVLSIYDPFKTSLQMKNMLLTHEDHFDYLRKHFPERYEFAYVHGTGLDLNEKEREILRRLHVKI